MSLSEQDKGKAIDILNRILEMELAGVVRYTHYSLMVYGYQRIPIVEWLQEQADEGLSHAKQAGELVTHLGGHPSLGIGPLLETERHDIGDILRESLEHEGVARHLYQDLLKLVQGRSVYLEEYARRLIADEERHADEVNKMLRRPGTFAVFAASEAGCDRRPVTPASASGWYGRRDGGPRLSSAMLRGPRVRRKCNPDP